MNSDIGLCLSLQFYSWTFIVAYLETHALCNLTKEESELERFKNTECIARECLQCRGGVGRGWCRDVMGGLIKLFFGCIRSHTSWSWAVLFHASTTGICFLKNQRPAKAVDVGKRGSSWTNPWGWDRNMHSSLGSAWGDQGEAWLLCLERLVFSWHHSECSSFLSISTLQGR